MTQLKHYHQMVLRELTRLGYKDRHEATLESHKIEDQTERFQHWYVESLAMALESAAAGNDIMVLRCFGQVLEYGGRLVSLEAFNASHLAVAVLEIRIYLEDRLQRAAGCAPRAPYTDSA